MRSCALATQDSPLPPIAILGVPFDNVTSAQAVATVERMIASRIPHYLVTANVDFLVQAREDVELRRILLDAHLVLCDGTPVLWASRLLGNKLAERVAGADLVPLLIREAEEKKFRVFFLGASPESCDQAVSRLRNQFPQLVIAGFYSPPFQHLLEMNHEEIARRIKETRPDLLFVSFGCPKQEKWIAMHYRSLGVPVAVGVGATIDFLAGRVKRAPAWMQRSGTEWIFRLAQEPRRLFRRYAKDLGVFGWNIVAQWWRMKPQRISNCYLRKDAAKSPEEIVRMPASLDCDAVKHDKTLGRLLETETNSLLDMSCVRFIDSTGVGFLVRMRKKMRAVGEELILIAPSEPVKRALKFMRLDGFFCETESVEAARRIRDGRLTESPVLPPENGSIALQGELTAANADEVWRKIELQLEQNSCKAGAMSVDLARLRFIDSTGLGLMVRLKKIARDNQRQIAFTGIQPAVRNVIKISRLESFLLN